MFRPFTDTALTVFGLFFSMALLSCTKDDSLFDTPDKTDGDRNIVENPRRFSASDITPVSVNLSWSGVENADYYHLIRDKKDKNDVPIDLGELKSTSFKDQVLIHANTTYIYTLYTFQNSGARSSGVTLTVTTLPIPDPSDLKVTNLTPVSLTISWDKVEGAGFYIVYRKEDSAADFVQSEEVSRNFYTDNNLQSGKTYIYKIVTYFEPSLDHSAGDSTITVTVPG